MYRASRRVAVAPHRVTKIDQRACDIISEARTVMAVVRPRCVLREGQYRVREGDEYSRRKGQAGQKVEKRSKTMDIQGIEPWTSRSHN